MPILYYCTTEMKAYLVEQGQVFISADGEDVDEKALKKLNLKVESSAVYSMVVATEPEAMRGVDYRAA